MSVMSTSQNTSFHGIFAITKTKVILGILLILLWTTGLMLPKYGETVKTIAKGHYNTLVEHLPAVKVDWSPQQDPKFQFNSSKVALLIESRPLPHLVPQLLHMMSVVPQDWRFKFIGSNHSVISVSRSFATQYHEANGKLDLVILPEPWRAENREDISRLFTDMRFYDEFLSGVEWLLKFESDSIMCANSESSLNDWLEYSWAGAPRRAKRDRYASSGGLSLRRISAIREVLEFQTRPNNTEAEDEWFSKRLILLPGAKLADKAQAETFSVDTVWHNEPMGYHVAAGGEKLSDDVWRDPERRRRNFEYCPELSIIMPMKLERERCDRDDMKGEIVPEGKKTPASKKSMII